MANIELEKSWRNQSWPTEVLFETKKNHEKPQVKIADVLVEI
jgi:hypothetical protein